MSTTLDMKSIFITEKTVEPDERNKKETLIEETLQIVNKNNSNRNRQLRFITLATIIVWLLNPWTKSKKADEGRCVSNDVNHWRSLAFTRGEKLDRFLAVINLQKRRIACLENDLQTLVNLAQDTQKLLAEIKPNGNSLMEN